MRSAQIPDRSEITDETMLPLGVAVVRRWRPQSVAHVVEFEGRPIDRLRRSWTMARKAAGLGPEVTPHILRHTSAT